MRLAGGAANPKPRRGLRHNPGSPVTSSGREVERAQSLAPTLVSCILLGYCHSMGDPERLGDLMLFRRLDACSDHVFALAWRIGDRDDPDPWTARLNCFKFGYGEFKAQAIRGATAALASAVRTVSWPQPVTLVSAIGHSDHFLADSSPLASLGAGLAASVGWTWAPSLLQKNPHAALHSIRCGAQRDAIVSGLYSIAASSPPPSGAIVILDDFATRGATIASIASAIRSVGFTGYLCGLVLGKHEKRLYGANNDGLSPSLGTLWDSA